MAAKLSERQKKNIVAAYAASGVSYIACEARFHRAAISSIKGGFITTQADLIEKDSGLDQS